MKTAIKNLAIVGGGPRGLSALESIYGHMAIKGGLTSFQTMFFESRELPGAGHVYDADQPDTNWLNVSERGLTISGRQEVKCDDFLIPSFPSYQEWAGYDKNENSGSVPDKFPLRSTLGKYLYERYVSIASVLEKANLLQVIKGEVIEMDWNEGKFTIALKDGTIHQSEELVLTIGHQSTKNSKQILDWSAYVEENNMVELITKPYPVSDILKSKLLGTYSVVALRGFGLAMIDVMRALTIGLGGEFKVVDEATQKMIYLKSGKEPSEIVPFSLDGLPMAPKLLNLEIDRWFFPTDEEKEDFKTTVGHIAEKGTATDIQFLIGTIEPIAFRVFKDLGDKAYSYDLEEEELHKIINAWLSDEEFEHPLIVPKTNTAEETLKAFVGMATGTESISLDFCIGHVWRHCQPTLYKAVSFSNLEAEIIADIVELDERIKRYSYGPPVASLQQLLALIKIGIVTLDFVNDPDIRTTEKGWELSKGKKSIIADLMINSVLDPPKLLDIDSPIVCNLLHESLVEPVHGELGIETYKNGCVALSEERDKIPLAVLGRLSKGTLIGVDAILECFGLRSELWAEGVVERMPN
ncbi:MAG: FAD/NAD(P)-binding protein [Saonia sp.]